MNRLLGRTWPVLLALVVAACSTPVPSTGPTPALATGAERPIAASAWPTAKLAPTAPSLPADQMAALRTVTKADEYPLYTMRYERSYDARSSAEDARLMAFARSSSAAAGCSLFAALANEQDPTFGRNFDWQYTPGLMLFYTPPSGYKSVSMTALSFLDYTDRLWNGLDKAALADRQQLLNAPAIAFDGMNEKGLVVGFARVWSGHAPNEPDKPTISTLYVIREMLDHAATIDEAVALLRGYNVWAGPQPTMHWLVEDRSGRAALLEFGDGQLNVIWNKDPWHMAVNWITWDPGHDPDNAAWRYAILERKLPEAKGRLDAAGAMAILDSVHSGTQWSTIYHPKTGDVEVAMGSDYTKVHKFHLDMAP